MSDEPVFTVDQVAEASTALHTALGQRPQHVSLARFIRLLADEIGQLRQGGWSDTEIAALLSESTGSVVPVGSMANLR